MPELVRRAKTKLLARLDRVCASRHGLVLRSERTVRARAPVRAGGGVEQPSLLDLLETETGENEINESERV